MIIKDKIQIGTKIIDIEFVENLVSDGDELYGDCNWGKCTIRINSSYPKQHQELALLHEIRHLIFDALGYRPDDEVKINEPLIIQQQIYDHQVMLQIIEWQKSK